MSRNNLSLVESTPDQSSENRLGLGLRVLGSAATALGLSIITVDRLASIASQYHSKHDKSEVIGGALTVGGSALWATVKASEAFTAHPGSLNMANDSLPASMDAIARTEQGNYSADAYRITAQAEQLPYDFR